MMHMLPRVNTLTLYTTLQWFCHIANKIQNTFRCAFKYMYVDYHNVMHLQHTLTPSHQSQCTGVHRLTPNDQSQCTDVHSSSLHPPLAFYGGTPQNHLGGLGSNVSSASGLGQSSVGKQFHAYFRPKQQLSRQQFLWIYRGINVIFCTETSTIASVLQWVACLAKHVTCPQTGTVHRARQQKYHRQTDRQTDRLYNCLTPLTACVFVC